MMMRFLLSGILGLLTFAPASLLAAEAEVESSRASPVKQVSKAGAKRQFANVTQSSDKAYSLVLSSQLRTAAVLDEDPSNDVRWEWLAGGRLEFVPDWSVFASFPMVQLFSVEEGESAFRLRDFRFGATFFKVLPLEVGPLSNLYAKQDLRVFVPTSRESLAQDMRFALELSSKETLELEGGFTLGLNVLGRYYNFAYAERNGLLGGMNPKFLGLFGGFAEYTLELPAQIPGHLSVGGGLSTRWLRKYDSSSDFESALSSTGFWQQNYGWSAYVDYTPWDYLSVSVGYEHGENVLKNGIAMYGNFDTFMRSIVDRNRTEFVASITGRY